MWFFGRVYEAEIEEIDRDNGTAAVTFTGYGNAEVIPLQNLKAVEEGKHLDMDGSMKPKSRCDQNVLSRAYCVYSENVLTFLSLTKSHILLFLSCIVICDLSLDVFWSHKK